MNIFSSYKSDVRGNVATLFGITTGLVLLLISIALTTIQSQSSQERLTRSADAAVLAAVKAVSDELSVLEEGDWEAEGQAVGRQVFLDNIAGMETSGDVDFDITLSLGSSNREIIADLTYTTMRKSFLSGILGKEDILLSNTVSASKTLYKYSRINFVVDVSGSMAIGADVANQELLEDQIGCAIVCHKNGSFTVARNQGIKLLIDTIKDAMRDMIGQLEDVNGRNEEFQVAIYSFSNSLQELESPTTNLADAIAAIDAIEVNGEDGQGGTNISHSLAQLNAQLPMGGNGSDADSRESFVVVLTDGVENSLMKDGTTAVYDTEFIVGPDARAFSSHETIQSFDSFLCQNLKSNGHTIAFLNPTYLIPAFGGANASEIGRFTFIRNHLISNIEQHSQNCASNTGFAFSAESDDEIARATKDLFDELIGQAPRLSD